MELLADFAQLQLPFVDQVQWRYEVIRPIVLFDDRTAAQRAVETHTHPETVHKLTRRFRQRGILGQTEAMGRRSGHPYVDVRAEGIGRIQEAFRKWKGEWPVRRMISDAVWKPRRDQPLAD